MSTSDSESEVFYDAVDFASGDTLPRRSMLQNPSVNSVGEAVKPSVTSQPVLEKSELFRQRRNELKKLRQALMESEFEDDSAPAVSMGETSSLSSASSSQGAACGPQRVPFRIIEDDSISRRTTASLGFLSRGNPVPLVGSTRQLSNSIGSLSAPKPYWHHSSPDGAIFKIPQPMTARGQEPDLVACSKSSGVPVTSDSESNVVEGTSVSCDSPDNGEFVIKSHEIRLPSGSSNGSVPEPPDYLPPPPIPPPRKKRGRKVAASVTSEASVASCSSISTPPTAALGLTSFSTPTNVFSPPGLPRAITPDKSANAEVSLDLAEAVKGLSLVQPFDDEAARGGGKAASFPPHRQARKYDSGENSKENTLNKNTMSGSDTLSSVHSEGGISKYYSFSDSTSSSSKRASLKSQKSACKSTSGSKDSGSHNNSKSSTLDSKRSTMEQVQNGSLDRRRKSSNLQGLADYSLHNCVGHKVNVSVSDGDEESALMKLGGITFPFLRTPASASKNSLDRESDIIKQVNSLARTRTPSGRLLSDEEILRQVTVLDLDSKERVPLSEADEKIPTAINPLSLHIMRLTSEYVSPAESKEKDSDEESIFTHKSLTSESGETSTVKRKTQQLKRFLGKTAEKAVHKAKGLAYNVAGSAKSHKGTSSALSVASGSGACSVSGGAAPMSVYGVGSCSGLESEMPESEYVDETVGQSRLGEIMKMKAASKHKGPYDFDNLKYVQCLKSDDSSALGSIAGPMIWAAKFSPCGRLLATASKEFITIWVLSSAYAFFADMRTKYNAKTSPTPSQENLHDEMRGEGGTQASGRASADANVPFCPTSFCTYAAHTAVVLDLTWSKECLGEQLLPSFMFDGSNCATVAYFKDGMLVLLPACGGRHFHLFSSKAKCESENFGIPCQDDRYFLSGSLDGKLRLWNIPDKKVALWAEVEGPTKLITAANFCQNGKFAAVGTYDGRVIFYNTDQFRYHTQIHIRSSSNSSKKYKSSRGPKVTGILPCQGEDKVLVSTTDSRIRLYDLRDLSLSCKYKGKGFVIRHNHIKANVSQDGNYIVTGTDNAQVYFWKTNHDCAKFSSARRDRNIYYESIRAMSSGVTLATFSPNPHIVFMQMERDRLQAEDPSCCPPEPKDVPEGYVVVTAENSGNIRIFLAKKKMKHSSLPTTSWSDAD
ncbi:unnamed protein product [Notodromas monacha]|uniref:WD repeat-containing protein 44 n=1 Tax=Notodromas monacha TaxID=399045 RepID=A0A7R9GGR5_9CRUS|nr:unnamed protein product [Notodromas monacha]CAG0920142.1 unnamed protein product [Notodromas monacha]